MASPSDQETARLAALRSYSVLDSGPLPAFDRITRRLAKLLRVPAAVISLIDEKRQWFLSSQGLPMKETPRDMAICQHAIESDALLIVPDAAEDARFRDNPLVLEPPHIRFYAGAPLRTQAGEGLGTLCVMDFKPRALSGEEAEILMDMAAIVMDELELLRSAREVRKVQAEVEAVMHSLEARVEQRTSELLLSNQALAAAEKRFRAIFEQAVDGMFQTTPDGHYLAANPALARMYGYASPEELMAAVGDIEHQLYVDPSRRQEFLGRINATGTIKAFESQIRRRDGSSLWISETARAVIDANGKVEMYEGTVKDISARKATEAALRKAYDEMEDRVRQRTAELEQFNQSLRKALRENNAFSAALRSSMLGVLITDAAQPDNPTVFANPAFEKITGYSQEEIIGKNCRFLQGPGSHPGQIDEMRTAIRAGRPFRGLLRNYRKDGTPFWNELAIDPVFDEHGVLIHFVGLQNDVTARVEAQQALGESEARKSAILNGALDAIITFDHTGKILEVNPATERVYGYSAEQMIGRTIAEMIVPPSGRAAHFSGLKSLFTSGDGPVLGRRRELLSMRADGSEFTIENAIHRIPGEGSPMFTVHIRDITLRKRNEAALHAAKEEAERANTAKSEFLSRMSHELRTPLNAILGFSQLMEMGALDAKQKESLGYIAKAGRHLLDLINEVLDLARIEAGHTHWTPESVDVYDVLAECIALLMPQAQQREITIQVEPALEARDWYVFTDRQRLKQIFINLLTNAVKYNRPAGSVTLRCFAGSSGQIATEFVDTGIGIAEDELPRLFTPFERLGAEKSGVEGTGIGLAITQRLAVLMGGNIEVASTAGVGSAFRVLLPSADSAPVEEFAESGGDATQIARPGCRTIVYIEDNSSNIRLMERIVSTTNGLNLVTCRSGAEALECALQYKPDIILLDLHLPDVCGADVLHQLRARPEFSETPIAIVSADAMGGQSAKLLKEGADAYITKPIHIHSMLRTIDQLSAAPRRGRARDLKKASPAR